MSEDANDSGPSFTARDWQNGVQCTAHGIPYCTPCFKVICGGLQSIMDDSQQRMDNIRAEVIRRIREGEMHHAAFHRPAKRNFFEDSRRKQFAASCQIGKDGNFLVVPIAFGIITDDPTESARRTTDDELRAILTNEHKWDTSTPEWAQYHVPNISTEDAMLLREMQLFV